MKHAVRLGLLSACLLTSCALFAVAGQLEYRTAPIQPLRWTVTVK